MNFYAFIFYLFPVIIAIISMVWGIVLLERHTYVLLYPWIMSIVYFIFFILLYLGMATYEKYGIWILSLLDGGGLFPFSIMWGGACMIANFCCAFIAEIYRGRVKEKEYIGFEKKYVLIYILVTFIPISIFLLSWIHYSIMDSPIVQIVFFIVLEIISIGIIMGVNKWKVNVKSPHYSCFIKMVISVILIGIFIIFEENMGFCLFLSCWLLYYLYYMDCEVKKSKQDTYPQTPNLNTGREISWLIEYIPIMGIVVSCILLTMLNHSN